MFLAAKRAALESTIYVVCVCLYVIIKVEIVKLLSYPVHISYPYPIGADMFCV